MIYTLNNKVKFVVIIEFKALLHFYLSLMTCVEC